MAAQIVALQVSAQHPNVESSREIRLKHKIVPVSNPVYTILDYYETSGVLPMLPQARPYTKQAILELLHQILNEATLAEREQKVIQNYLLDFGRESNGVQMIKGETAQTFAVLGFGAETTVRTNSGEHGTWSTNLIGEPYLSGDLGQHLTFHAAMGASIEKLAPDLFYQSFTKDHRVNFPFQSVGYAFLPYQFNYETLYTHALISSKSAGHSNITKEMAVGMIYHTELNANWLNGAIQLSVNNQRRSWGHDNHNLVLSSTARRFPGIEFKLEPTSWLRYSYLTGSLFSYASQSSDYKKNIYGYDLGDLQNNFTLHLLELTPVPWFQISASAGNVWSKRMEISYLMPFVFSHFSEVEVGDYDNLTMGIDLALKFKSFGKAWLSVFNDEFSFTESGPLLRMPRNRYAWQLGWKSNLLSQFIRATTSTLKYTRLTPFVYTHYTENRFNTFRERPLDMTYTHDEFNLGFYLPPNSGELSWTLTNVAVPDLVLCLENKLIIHGTNDLSNSNVYQIYGDIYRHQLGGDIQQYPLLDFTNDGIYDWTVLSELKFDWKVRKAALLSYFRVTGSLGFARTWWKTNASGVVPPSVQHTFNGSLGIMVDI